VYRKLCELREWGIADEVLSQVEQAWSIIYEYVASGQWNERWDEEFEPLIRKVHAVEEIHRIPLQHYARENPVLSPIPPLLTASQLKEGYGGLAPELAYDPIGDYERVRCPVLFLMGELDRNLPPQECVDRVEQALQQGHHHATIKVFPQTGHDMNVISSSVEGMTLEEATHLLYQYRFPPGFLDLMSRWVIEQVGHPTEGDGSSLG
jgi:pimeloyl-ACP methyl ester carboxylesterase